MAASIQALVGTSVRVQGPFTAGIQDANRLSRQSGAFLKKSVLHSSKKGLNQTRLSLTGLDCSRRRALAACASADKSEKPGFGLGGPGTYWGFGKRQEREVGRLAMIGFMAGLIMEVLTGKGVLAQLGMDPVAVRYPFLLGLVFLTVGGLLGGYVVINNPPDFEKIPPNDGEGLPRNPLKTYDPKNVDPLTMYSRGGVVQKNGQMEREPYSTDIDLPKK